LSSEAINGETRNLKVFSDYQATSVDPTPDIPARLTGRRVAFGAIFIWQRGLKSPVKTNLQMAKVVYHNESHDGWVKPNPPGSSSILPMGNVLSFAEGLAP
jgi:hypothetical protein